VAFVMGQDHAPSRGAPVPHVDAGSLTWPRRVPGQAIGNYRFDVSVSEALILR